RWLIEHPEKMLPWEDSWLPIATNGGDDFYVYVTDGKRRGAVLFYLHDDARRSVIAKSLRLLAERLSKALAVLDRPQRLVTLTDPVEPLTQVAAPSLTELRREPVGTLY